MSDSVSDDDMPGGTQLATPVAERKRPRRDLEFRGSISVPVVEQERVRICCNIHDSVFAEPLIKKLMDTDEMQRLKRLKQLGTAQHIYPGAQHTRFIHSLGVMHLGEVLCKRLRERPMPMGVERPSDRDILCVKIAGLCHDLGHGPFSHVFDGKVVPAAASRAYEEGRNDLARKLDDYKHEDMSIKMIKRMFERAKINLDDWDANGQLISHDGPADDHAVEHLSHFEDLRFIQELILGADLEGGVRSRKGRGPSKWYLYDIISNVDSGLDVDKLDYLLRDMREAIGISGMTLEPLLQNAAVRNARFKLGSGGGRPGAFTSEWVGGEELETRPVIAYPQKAALPVLEAFKTRHDLHAKLYKHKGVIGFDALVTDFLLAADRVFVLLKADGLRLGEAPDDADAFARLDDSSVLTRYEAQLEDAERCLRGTGADDRDDFVFEGRVLSKAEVATVRRLLGRVQANAPYKALAQRLLSTDKEVEMARASKGKDLLELHMARLAQLHDSAREDFYLHVRHIDYGKKARNPLSGVRFFRKSDAADAVAGADAQLGESHLPCAFESRKLVLYWKGEPTDIAGLQRARKAAAAWSVADTEELMTCQSLQEHAAPFGLGSEESQEVG